MPYRRIALISSELARHKIDIAAFSEARESWLRRSQAILFSAPDDKCGARVDYSIKTSLVGKLPSLSKRVNDCLMTMTLPLHHGKKVRYNHQGPIRKIHKTSYTKTFNMLSPLFPLRTSSPFGVTLLLDLDKKLPPGKEYTVNTGPENATVTHYCFFRPAPSIIF